MNKYITEFIGTFFLVLVIGLTVMSPNGAGIMAPVAIGVTLMVMVYAGGYRSGGHYNPAVTLAAFVRKKCSAADVLPYMLSQCAGAVVASFIAVYLKGASGISTPPASLGPVVVAELLFTFALAYVVLGVATAKKNEGNSFYGIAIGGTVLAGAYAVGPISGGAFNPAVALGALSMGITTSSTAIAAIGADFLGGFLAGIIVQVLDANE